MRVTIVGTGNMGRAIATRALAGGHHVTFVGTDIAPAQELADEFTALGPVQAAEQADGDLVVLAVPYTEAPHVVREHAGELGGAVVVDITNPIDAGVLEPLDVAPFSSGAEVIADVAPEGVSVVKAFNTNLAGTLVAGEVAGQPLDVFIAGDDAGAKERVAQVVRDGGMRPVDTGALRRARELEAMGLVHMVVQGPLGTAFASALKVVSP